MGLMSCAMGRAIAALLCILMLAAGTSASAAIPFRFGLYPSGPLNGITDVPGVMVSNVTKVEGRSIRTGATAILPNADPWAHKVSAAAFPFNGNGEMTGTHWVNEAGFLETPIVLTDTLDIGRADDGVISWMMRKHPEIGVHDTVPLPVVAECDDQFLNDITARAVSANDVVQLLDSAKTGEFARGGVGAGTGMAAFSFKGGIGSASRVIPKDLGGYTVGVLVNDNTSGGGTRRLLTINGVHVGARLANEYKPHVGQQAALHGRPAYGSIIIVIATNAPLDSRQLRALAKRAALGMARTGLYSALGSGDVFIAFSTGYVFERTPKYDIEAPHARILQDEDTLNAVYLATVEATEGAIYDALFNGKTTTGKNGDTVYGLPVDRVMKMLEEAKN
ncbi:MAG TPA: P1 family peptidase [Candidatus Baltobacteraceae bacterium]|nr:P1 family peptidase [Candidatus Baltobacteraceae bacterium]